MTYGLAVAAAAVAIPLTAGSASAAPTWHDLAGGPEMYPNMAACQADIPRAKKDYQDATCVNVKGRISLWVLY
jgi:hypothetical protein